MWGEVCKIKIGTLSLMLGLDCFLTPMANSWLIRYSIELLFISMFIGVEIVFFVPGPKSANFAWLMKMCPLKVRSHLNLSLAFCRKRTFNFNVIYVILVVCVLGLLLTLLCD